MIRTATTTAWTIGFAILLTLIVAASTAQARDKKLKLATIAPKGTTYYNILMKMRDKWKDAGVKLTIYPDGVMGGESDMVRRMRVDQIQVSMMTANGLAEIDPIIAGLQNMPLMFRSFEEAEYVRRKLMPEIQAKFESKGFKLLFIEDAGWVQFFCNTPAMTPDDFKKLKVFALSADVKGVTVWKEAGFTPVPLDTTDMITGLKTGLVDVVPAPPEYALAGQFYGPAPHMIDLKWAPMVGGIVITTSAWEKLKPAQQQAMQEAATEAGKGLMAECRQGNDDAVEAMKKRGLTVHVPTAAQLELWRQEVEKAYPKIRGDVVPVDMFDKVQKLLEEFRAQKKSE